MCTTNTKKGANEVSILFSQQKFKTSTQTAVVNEDACFSSCSVTGKKAKGNNQIKQNNVTKKKEGGGARGGEEREQSMQQNKKEEDNNCHYHIHTELLFKVRYNLWPRHSQNLNASKQLQESTYI